MPTPPTLAADARGHGCTCSQLRRLTRRVTAHYDHALAPCGLRVTQYSLMAQIHRLASPTLSALADAIDMDRTTLSRNLGPLVDAGWVELVPGAQGRNRVARLTAAGLSKWRVARASWRAAQDAIEQTLGTSQVARLHADVDIYLERLRPLAAAQASR
ncbi:MAG TPA: MarR family winged helix-turn-helix transcriptional regulator [Burkholderiaceae bacterium]|nr:MarR family winged helix-turn-helix transcriptional regulator [Burkholderiaceae bacterium]